MGRMPMDTYDYVMNLSDINLELGGQYLTKTPLSHTSEMESNNFYLIQEPILQPDGSVVEMFSYSADAWRGQLRNLMTKQVCEAVDAPVPSVPFHSLLSGWSVEKALDPGYARDVRRALPMISLLGGVFGSQTLTGKLRITNAYPICREAVPVLSEHLHAEAEHTRFGALTFEKAFPRRDGDVFGTEAVWLRSGVRLYQQLDGHGLTAREVGCLTAAFRDFSTSPFVGSQNSRGHGLVDLSYGNDGGEDGREYYIMIRDGWFECSDYAAECERCYLAHLDSNSEWIKGMLKGV